MGVQFHSPVRAYKAERAEIDRAVAGVLAGGRYILGPEVSAFEEEFAAYTGVPHAIGVATGTDALVLALKAAGIGPGDEVVTAANAGGYATTACVLVGATPVFADVRELDLTLCPASAADAITARTRAIVATHLYGSMADVDALSSLAKQHGVVFIEDCAQAHGATRGGRRAGSVGDIGTFSFYPTKNLGGIGDGGAIVCRDEAIAESLRELRQYGWRGKYDVQRFSGMNSRLDPIQAAVLRVRLPRLDERNARRRALVDRYEHSLSSLGIDFCRGQGDAFVGHLCVVRVHRRDAVQVALTVRGIGTDIHYPTLDPDQPAWSGAFGNQTPRLPVSRHATGQILSLPLYPELTDSEVDEVCEAVAESVRSAPARAES